MQALHGASKEQLRRETAPVMARHPLALRVPLVADQPGVAVEGVLAVGLAPPAP